MQYCSYLGRLLAEKSVLLWRWICKLRSFLNQDSTYLYTIETETASDVRGWKKYLRTWVIIYIIKAGVCLSLLKCPNPNYTSPPVLGLWDGQGYLWLPYDLMEVIKLIGETFVPKKYFMSFLPHYCHSFRITVIPSKFLSFLPY